MDNDGYVYDKADSPYNSTPRELYGHIDYNNRIYRGRDAYDKSYDKAGAVDYLGYVYNDMDMMCKATRIGYVQGSCIYDEGPIGDYPTTSPIASIFIFVLSIVFLF